MARETRAVRLSGTSARGVAVLGLLVLASAAIAGFSAVRVHADPRFASLGAAADVPAARIREVDVMRNSSLAVVGAVMVATEASAGGKGDGVPPGWMVIADAYTQFSNTQGQDGWTYHYDSGPGSTVQFMPFNPVWNDGAVTTGSWCIAPRVGCSSVDTAVCHISSRPVDAPPALRCTHRQRADAVRHKSTDGRSRAGLHREVDSFEFDSRHSSTAASMEIPSTYSLMASLRCQETRRIRVDCSNLMYPTRP